MLKLLAFYYICAIIYLAVRLLTGSKQILARILILLFCPFISIALIWALDRRQEEPDGTPFQASMEWIIQQNGRRELYFKEERQEVVPLTDALLLNDDREKRQMLIRLLKDYSIDHMSILQKALENDDTETSHYAAAAIQELKRKLVKNLQTLEFEVELNPDDPKLLSAYAKALAEYVKSGLFEERTSKRYMFQYRDSLEKLIQLEPEASEHHISKIDLEINLKEYESALKDARRFLESCPGQEEAYFSMMKVYYVLRDHENFQAIITMLRHSQIRLSPVGLEKLRFWLYKKG